MATEQMTIEKKINGNSVELRLNGWMDTQNAPQLAAAVDELGPEVERLVFDMSGLEYVSSAGIRQIVATHKRMDGALTLKHVAPVVKDVLTAMGLDKKLNIEQ